MPVTFQNISGLGKGWRAMFKSVKWYVINLLIATDQWVNALLGGWCDETLSSYSYRLERDGKLWGRIWRPVIDLLFFWQGPRHCEAAYIKERERVHSPPEQRNPIQGA